MEVSGREVEGRGLAALQVRVIYLDSWSFCIALQSGTRGVAKTKKGRLEKRSWQGKLLYRDMAVRRFQISFDGRSRFRSLFYWIYRHECVDVITCHKKRCEEERAEFNCRFSGIETCFGSPCGIVNLGRQTFGVWDSSNRMYRPRRRNGSYQ